MGKPIKPRNNLVELFRFIYSLLVLGYHIQFSYDDEKVDPFENGALAVEFYFLLSGYFLARSLEKINKDEKTSLIKKWYSFMKNKITAILNVHILSIIVVIIIIACFDKNNFKNKFLNGLPSVFFVQMFIVWAGDFDKALIVPEWYLSAMLICMLFMVPIFLILIKKIKGIFCTIILVGVLSILAIIAGACMKWIINENIVYDLRAWGEMCVGMFSYYLSIYIKNKDFGNCMTILLKSIETLGYGIPVIFGIIPLSKNYQGILMGITVVLEFLAIFITFSDKGNIISNQIINGMCGYLGSISLPIYLFHPVLITLIDYIDKKVKRWIKYIIVFPVSLILALLYRIIADYFNKNMKEKEKQNKETKGKENENEDINKDYQNYKNLEIKEGIIDQNKFQINS